MTIRSCLAAICLLAVALPALAQPPLTPEQDARARLLMTEFACVVCEGQSIAESDAAAAEPMRAAVIAAVAEGLSDDAVRDRMAERYGEAALLNPRARGATVLLWIAPLVFLTFGAVIVRQAFQNPVSDQT